MTSHKSQDANVRKALEVDGPTGLEMESRVIRDQSNALRSEEVIVGRWAGRVMTDEEVMAVLALHALEVLRDFPDGNLTRIEVDQLAVQALAIVGQPVPEWRVSV